jgi:prophage maintenance system killer protein
MASVEDIRFLNTSTNCKTISGRIENGHIDMFGNEIADIATIEKIYIYDQSKTVQLYLTASDWTESAGVLTFTTTSTTAFVGVISVELHDATTLNYDLDADGVKNETAADTTLMETLYTVASCQIDCCIAKLVDAAIECHCKCDKCKEDLLRAEKVFLMLQGATFAAEQESNYDHAVSMYNKANTLCVEVCACGC